MDFVEPAWTNDVSDGLCRIAVTRLSFEGSRHQAIDRIVPIEAPVAIEYNGIGYAVMMATPTDLDDFVIGFTVSEGLTSASELDKPEIIAVKGGWIARLSLPVSAMPAVTLRARNRMSESGCGLCGIDSIAAVLAPLPNVTARIAVRDAAISAALEQLGEHQRLGRASGATHAAAFCLPDGAIQCVREDVGRHNAFDKLIGALARAVIDPASGFALLSARCSQELVEKAVRSGFPMLVTISAPTSFAVDRAKEAELALVALARTDSALVINDPHGTILGS